VISWPLKKILPAAVGIRRKITRPVVLLPSGILYNSRLAELIDRIRHLEDTDDLTQVAELLKR